MNTGMSIFDFILAVAVIGIGLYLFTTGFGAWISGARRIGEPGGRFRSMVSGFRTGVVGLAIVGVGIWINTGQTWILVLSLAVGGEEILETSVMLWALQSDPRRK